MRFVRQGHITKGHITRSTALCLLLFAMADITSSETCGEKLELLGFPNSSVWLFSGRCPSQAATSTSVRQPQPDGPVDCIPEDDDCLCWCPHVVPSLGASLDTITIELAPLGLKKTSLLISHPQRVFHPPRSF